MTHPDDRDDEKLLKRAQESYVEVLDATGVDVGPVRRALGRARSA